MPGSGKSGYYGSSQNHFMDFIFSNYCCNNLHFSIPNEWRGTHTICLTKLSLGEAHILNPHCSGYARKCYHVCFANTGMRCHGLSAFLLCVPTPTYISVQMDRHNLWWEQTGARGGGSQQLTADVLSVQATLWSNFTRCVSVD